VIRGIAFEVGGGDFFDVTFGHVSADVGAIIIIAATGIGTSVHNIGGWSVFVIDQASISVENEVTCDPFETDGATEEAAAAAAAFTAIASRPSFSLHHEAFHGYGRDAHDVIWCAAAR